VDNFVLIKNIDANLIDASGRTFLFYLTNYTSIFNVLQSDLPLNVNHLYQSHTFITLFFYKCADIMPIYIYRLIGALNKHNYDFNIISWHGISVFSAAFPKQRSKNKISSTKPVFPILRELIKNPTQKITIDVYWLSLLLNPEVMSYHYQASLRRTLACIMNREDYVSFLCKVIKKYQYMQKMTSSK